MKILLCNCPPEGAYLLHHFIQETFKSPADYVKLNGSDIDPMTITQELLVIQTEKDITTGLMNEIGEFFEKKLPEKIVTHTVVVVGILKTMPHLERMITRNFPNETPIIQFTKARKVLSFIEQELTKPEPVPI